MQRQLSLWLISFCPQFRAGRLRYAKETLWSVFWGWMIWLSIDWVAAIPFLSDEDLMWIGRIIYPLIINLVLIFMTVASARRLHDIGHSGAWSFMMLVPGLNVVLLIYLLIRPSSALPTGWRRLEDL